MHVRCSQFNCIVICGYTYILKLWIEIACKMTIAVNWHLIIIVSLTCEYVFLWQIHLLTLILLELLTFFLLPTHQFWLCIFSLFPQLYSAFIISPFAACSTQLPLHLAVSDCLSSFPLSLSPVPFCGPPS